MQSNELISDILERLSRELSKLPTGTAELIAENAAVRAEAMADYARMVLKDNNCKV